METNLKHEDLLIKLRAKLNDEKIKLWEPPYIQPDAGLSKDLQELAAKYSVELSIDNETILQGLEELQVHSIDRSKANAEFKETGVATFRVKATLPGEKPRVMKIHNMLDVEGSTLIGEVATELGISDNRIKLIFNGKLVNATKSLQEQGLKNGAQIMALILAESPEDVKKEEKMYMEMKSTRDDAMLLSESVDDLADDDEYMKLEDQSGKTVELPPVERRALLVGLALHGRGRAAAKQKHHPLALLLLLEADRHLSECSSSILKTVDNYAVLQLDIAWCYLCLQNLSSAADAAARLKKAEEYFRNSYGDNHERLIALKGTAANERVLFMRLYLLQGIVAYHQNKRSEAKRLLEKAEIEMNALRVDEEAVQSLMALGWSRSQAAWGLRARGSAPAAHQHLRDQAERRARARDKHARDRRDRLLGICEDGSPVNPQLVEALVGMGFAKRLAATALRNTNNHAAEAVRLIQEEPELLEDSESSGETDSGSSEGSIEPDNRLVAELEEMGYTNDEARMALRLSRNNAHDAIDLLVAGRGNVVDAENPSTSAGAPKKKHKKHKRDKKKKEREQALHRLSTAIRTDEDDHLDSSLVEEGEYLAQYKSLL